MTQITPNLLKTLRTEIDKAVLEIAKKYDVEIKAGNASYSANFGTLKLEISAKDANGEIFSKEAEAFKKYAQMYDLKPEYLGMTFKSGNKTFKITGLNTKANKMPVEATCVETGGTYKFAVISVKTALAK